MRKLLIISSSPRVIKQPQDPIPAIQRFDGAIIRIVKKYYKQMSNIDILILSPVYGLIKAEDKIRFKKPIYGYWYKFRLNEENITFLRKRSLSNLKILLEKRKYDEIYVNAGRNLLEIIKGFDRIVPQSTKITYSKGPGIGPKMAHMKKWIESNLRAN